MQALLPRLAWRRHAAPRRLHSAAPHRSLPIAFCPAQVSYTFHAFETFSPEHSCPTCTLDDTLTVLNRWGMWQGVWRLLAADLLRLGGLLAAKHSHEEGNS